MTLQINVSNIECTPQKMSEIIPEGLHGEYFGPGIDAMVINIDHDMTGWKWIWMREALEQLFVGVSGPGTF